MVVVLGAEAAAAEAADGEAQLALELLPEDGVDEDVAGAVDRHQEVGDFWGGEKSLYRKCMESTLRQFSFSTQNDNLE